MKNNQVYLDPHNLTVSLARLAYFYPLDPQTLDILERILRHFPKGVIVYVDEANAPLQGLSELDDPFTFDTETGELILFSAEAPVFIDALIEMWMFIMGFETLMGSEHYWHVEMAIGAWKGVKNNLKAQLGIPIQTQKRGIFGLPPSPEEAPLEDPYPFRTLVASLNILSFTQMIRLAGREQISVHFPRGTDPKVIEVYYTARTHLREISQGLGVQDAAEFNRRLKAKIAYFTERYQPQNLPTLEEWNASQDKPSAHQDALPDNAGGVLLGPPSDTNEIGDLPLAKAAPQAASKDDMREIDARLAASPFASFIETLFDD